MILGRLIMRVLLVPLGAGVAVLVATLVVVIANWRQVSSLSVGDADGLVSFFVVMPLLGLSAAFMMLPGIITLLIAEAFAIRSWIYHALCGGLSAWISVSAVGALDKMVEFYEDPVIAIAAGIAAGFAYWLVTGWSAGFWRPVFERPPEPAPPPAP